MSAPAQIIEAETLALAPTPVMVHVTAPSSLEGGYMFDAVYNGVVFPVTVPPGGVKAGQKFSVPFLPAVEAYAVAVAEPLAPPQTQQQRSASSETSPMLSTTPINGSYNSGNNNNNNNNRGNDRNINHQHAPPRNMEDRIVRLLFRGMLPSLLVQRYLFPGDSDGTSPDPDEAQPFWATRRKLQKYDALLDATDHRLSVRTFLFLGVCDRPVDHRLGGHPRDYPGRRRCHRATEHPLPHQGLERHRFRQRLHEGPCRSPSDDLLGLVLGNRPCAGPAPAGRPEGQRDLVELGMLLLLLLPGSVLCDILRLLYGRPAGPANRQLPREAGLLLHENGPGRPGMVRSSGSTRAAAQSRAPPGPCPSVLRARCTSRLVSCFVFSLFVFIFCLFVFFASESSTLEQNHVIHIDSKPYNCIAGLSLLVVDGNRYSYVTIVRA